MFFYFQGPRPVPKILVLSLEIEVSAAELKEYGVIGQSLAAARDHDLF